MNKVEEFMGEVRPILPSGIERDRLKEFLLQDVVVDSLQIVSTLHNEFIPKLRAYPKVSKSVF